MFKLESVFRKKKPDPEFVEFSWFDKLFSDEEVDQIVNLWNINLVQDAEVSSGAESIVRGDLRKTEVMFIKSSDNQWIYDRIWKAAVSANNRYYHFDLSGFQSELQLMKYGQNHFFNWHMDFGDGIGLRRKLSVSVQMSSEQDYQGGDFQFMINEEQISAPKTKGTGIVFPSFVQHRVTPVTSGFRKSLVGLIEGPPFK
jgi:PKHD-type hydroxylase